MSRIKEDIKHHDYRKGSFWQSSKDGLWYAEIQYLGKRYKTKGVKNKETAENWLERKRSYICELIDKKRKRLSEIKEEAKECPPVVREVVRERADYKGSISSYHTIKRGKEITRYVGEVQCLGRRVRHFSVHRDRVEKWIDEVLSNVNRIRDSHIKSINENYESYVRKDMELRAAQYAEVDKYLETLGVKVENYAKKQDDIRLKTYKETITYILLDNSSSLYKIGKTKNLKQRLSAFCNPSYCFEMIHLGDIEKKLHKEFFHRRLEGEWFELTPGDIEVIKSRYIFYSIDN